MDFVGSGRKVTPAGVLAVSKALKVDGASVLAVMAVESNGRGFDGRGRPKMLFEPHVFYRNITGSKRAAAVKAGLAYKVWKRDYPKDSYPRLTKAMAIDEEAALRSASWGLFQILGDNHEAAGYPSAAAMVEAFKTGEDEQLAAFGRLISAWGIADDLRDARDSFFARYNGPRHAEHDYRGRFLRAREKYRREAAPKPLPIAEPVAPLPGGESVSWYAFGPDALTKRGDGELRTLQQYLLDDGYRTVGAADGIWGHKTIGALAEFRAINDLPDVQADLDKPRIDERTRTRLRMRDAKRWTPSEERANATEATVARKAPWLAWPAKAAKAVGKGISVVGTGAAAATVGAANQLGESWSLLSAAKDFITSPWVLGGLAVLLALALWAVGSGVMKGGEEAVRTGELN